MDLRNSTGSELITAEHCDLSSLHSIRRFATKWVDNAPPRRLDMIILCANTFTPSGGRISQTEDGLESSWGLNYMANFHLLSILSPALRAQPPDRDVRVIFGMCSSYMAGNLNHLLHTDDEAESVHSQRSGKNAASKTSTPEVIDFTPSSAHSASKLALLVFADSFQKHLSNYVRPDKAPMNARVIVVDPGWTRTPGMRRYLTFGSLWGLLLYLILYPIWWLILKSPLQGAQSFLYASLETGFGVGVMAGEGDVIKPDVQMSMIKECKDVAAMRPEVRNETLQKALWKESERTIQALEKDGAMRRAREKKDNEGKNVDRPGEAAGNLTAASGSDAQKKAGSRRSKKER